MDADNVDKNKGIVEKRKLSEPMAWKPNAGECKHRS